jgi:hypothetical protein
MMFVVNNLGEFQTNSFLHGINTKCKIQLHIPAVRLSSIKKGVTYSSMKIFNSLPSNILKLQNDKLIFKSALRRYLRSHAFYSSSMALRSVEFDLSLPCDSCLS